MSRVPLMTRKKGSSCDRAAFRSFLGQDSKKDFPPGRKQVRAFQKSHSYVSRRLSEHLASNSETSAAEL